MSALDILVGSLTLSDRDCYKRKSRIESFLMRSLKLGDWRFEGQ